MSRRVSQTALYAALCLLLAPAAMPGATALRLSHETDATPLVLHQLRVELSRIAEPSRHDFAWVKDNSARPGRRVSVRLLGSCTGDLEVHSKRGPLGWTKVISGRILPFVEIDCDRVRATILPDVSGDEQPLREVALGRALARVLAHELRHVLAQTLDHHDHGLAGASLNSRDLLYGTHTLTAEDLRRPEEPRPRLARPEEPVAAAPAPEPADDLGR
jgi:hypothetical protein